MIDLDTHVSASEHQVSSVVDEEQVILNLENGTYYGLDGVGARVWQLVQEPRSVSAICEVLLAEFEVGPRQLHQDVVALLNDLDREGLIQLEPQSSGA